MAFHWRGNRPKFKPLMKQLQEKTGGKSIEKTALRRSPEGCRRSEELRPDRTDQSQIKRK
jgi:hypothetical protein